MDCNYCNGQFCIKCFRLEVHNCPGQEEKIKKERENLIKKLEYEPEPKHLKI